MSGGRSRLFFSAIRTGWLAAATPPREVPQPESIELSWLNEATLVGISVPPPRSKK